MKKNRKKIILIATILCLMSPFSTFASDNEVDEDMKITDEVKNVDKAGTYFVQISGKNELGQVMKKKARVHVKYPKTELNYDLMEGIDAHDIIVLTGSFNNLSEQAKIEEAGAHAWSMEDGSEIKPVTVSDEPPIKETGAASRVKFATKNDTSVYANVYEQDAIYLKLAQIYMTQRPVLTNKFRTLSLLIISLTVVPGMILLCLFRYVSKKTEEMENLLNK